MQKIDPYTDPDSQAEATLHAISARLEERGKNAEFLAMVREYAARLPSERPLTVLDLGCGTGVAIRQLRSILHPESILHGADISNHFLNEACQLSPESGIHWQHLTSEILPYNDNSFDAVIMHTLLSHVPDPVAVLAEAARLLKPEAKLIIFDADHASTTYSLPDYALMRRIDHTLSSSIATHPDICRQLPRHLKSAGLVLEDHTSRILSECGRGDYWLSSVQGFARMFPTLGILEPEDARKWVEHMLHSHNEATFFASGAFYTFYATP